LCHSAARDLLWQVPLGDAHYGIHTASSAASTQQLQQLMQLLKDFSSADILLALMLMQGGDSKNKS